MAGTETFSPRIRPILFKSLEEEVSQARKAVRENLKAYPGTLVDRVEQCASETFTNAILHGPKLRGRPARAVVVMLIIEREASLRVEVINDRTEIGSPHVIKDLEPALENGRGLFLVEAIADAWGFYEDECGINVWFEVNISGPS